jgi:hypothetical protein
LDGDALPDTVTPPPGVCPTSAPTPACTPSSNIAGSPVEASPGPFSPLSSSNIPKPPSPGSAASFMQLVLSKGAESDGLASIWSAFEQLRSTFPASQTRPEATEEPQPSCSATNESVPDPPPNFQMVLERVKVTHVATFWTAVHGAAEHGKLVAGRPHADQYDEAEPPTALSVDLSNTVIMLGRSLTQVRGTPCIFRLIIS